MSQPKFSYLFILFLLSQFLVAFESLGQPHDSSDQDIQQVKAKRKVIEMGMEALDDVTGPLVKVPRAFCHQSDDNEVEKAPGVSPLHYLGRDSQIILQELGKWGDQGELSPEERAGMLSFLNKVDQATSDMKVTLSDVKREMYIVPEAFGWMDGIEEKAYNSGGYSFRSSKVYGVLAQFMNQAHNNTQHLQALKEAFKKIHAGDEDFIRFVDGITSFAPDMIHQIYEASPEQAEKIFTRREIFDYSQKTEAGESQKRRFEPPQYRYGYKFNGLEALDLVFAPLNLLKNLRDNSDRLVVRDIQDNDGHGVELAVMAGKGEEKNVPTEKAVQLGRRAIMSLRLQGIYGHLESEVPLKSLSLAFYPATVRKQLPPWQEGNPVFTINETNSAEAGMRINVFRLEEGRKTTIHEVHHKIGADHLFGTNEDDVKFVLDHFAIQRIDEGGKPLMAEALTESFALINNVTMTALELAQKHGLSNERRDELMLDYWQREKEFQLFQTAKILALSGFDSIKEFISPQETTKRVKEGTSTAEYHILKTLMTYRPEEFLKIVTAGKGTEGPEKEKRSAFIKELMLTNARDQEFQGKVDGLIKLIKSKVEQKDQQFLQSSMFQTMRMTAIEEDW